MFSLSVIVPVYNEAPLLPAAIQKLSDFLKTRTEKFEILIIESGSTDGSGAVADEIAKKIAGVHVIHEPARNGFGSAMLLGYRHASMDYVWLVTVDFPFPLESLDRAIPLLGTFDCVLSYRDHDNRSFSRRFRSAVFNSVARSILGLPTRHINSAFKLIHREHVQKLPIEAKGWLFDAELVFHLTHRGVRWTEIPVSLIQRTEGRSSVTWLTAFVMLRDLLLFRYRLRANARTQLAAKG